MKVKRNKYSTGGWLIGRAIDPSPCSICDFAKGIEVHHINGDHDINCDWNLAIVCEYHHMRLHQFSDLPTYEDITWLKYMADLSQNYFGDKDYEYRRAEEWFQHLPSYRTKRDYSDYL